MPGFCLVAIKIEQGLPEATIMKAALHSRLFEEKTSQKAYLMENVKTHMKTFLLPFSFNYSHEERVKFASKIKNWGSQIQQFSCY